MIVTDEAFDELLDRAAIVEGESEEPTEEGAERRRLFAVAVDRAVKNASSRRDRRAWQTQTLKRFGCRLHFLRNEKDVFLLACVALDDEEPDHST